MQTFAVVAIATGVVLAAGGAFVMDDPLGWFEQECQGEPTPSLAPSSSAYRLRLTLQDNTTGSDVRTCFLDAAGGTLFDQTYRVEGETGWMWDVYLSERPSAWIVQFGNSKASGHELSDYLSSSSCREVAPEFLATKIHGLSMIDCDLPSKYIPQGMSRQYATSEANVQSQSVVPWDVGSLQGGGAAAVTVVAGGSAGLFIGWRFRRPLHWLAAGLFTRIVKPRVLEHPVRNELVQLVQTEPGIHRAEIARRLELAAGQTIHHLRVLVQQNVLSEVHNGWSKHYVVWGKYSPQTARQIVALRKDLFATLLDLARANQGVSLQRLAQLANQSKSHTSKSIKALERVGLVRVERNGRWVRIFANPSVPN